MYCYIQYRQVYNNIPYKVLNKYMWQRKHESKECFVAQDNNIDLCRLQSISTFITYLTHKNAFDGYNFRDKFREGQ